MNPRTLEPSNPQCIALVGPTGVGKTAVALEFAERFHAEIVNLDSRQVYRGLDIGSAKPTPAERERLPHHLFDVVAPDEGFDCARYRDLALEAIATIRARGNPILLVGGTGLYLKTLRHGLCPAPARDASLRAALIAKEVAKAGSLHQRLREVDPESASRLHPNDRVRLVRALEVWQLTGRPLSVWQEEHGFARTDLDVTVVGMRLERSALYARIDARCRGMIDAGIVDEVRGLWASGYGPDLPALRSIGYREIGAHLLGRCDFATAIDDMARRTRNLAKRQLTWFRADPTIRWCDVEGCGGAALAAKLYEQIAVG